MERLRYQTMRDTRGRSWTWGGDIVTGWLRLIKGSAPPPIVRQKVEFWWRETLRRLAERAVP